MISKKRCISILNMWLTMIEAVAIDGELKLTKKGTVLLTDNLEWIRGYLIDAPTDTPTNDCISRQQAIDEQGGTE